MILATDLSELRLCVTKSFPQKNFNKNYDLL